MKWKAKKYGTRRLRWKFILWPVRRDGWWHWLEFKLIEEEYQEGHCEHDFYIPDGWYQIDELYE